MLKITIEDGGLIQKLTAMIAKAERISAEVWDDISTRFIESIHMGFEIGGNPSWLPTKRGNKPLIGSGRLMNSVEESSRGENFIEWEMGAGLPYARIQQQGGVIPEHSIPITAKMRRFFWAMYYQSGDEKWKFMALIKQGGSVYIPTIIIDSRRYFKIYDDMEQYIIEALHEYLLTDNSRFPMTI
jgi:phage gpG-like protein